MTVLYAIQALAPVVGSDVACTSLLPTAIAAARDRVPNIRFNVAKLLHTLVPLLDSSVHPRFPGGLSISLSRSW